MSIQNQGLGRTVTRVIGQGQPGGGLYVSSGATGFGQVPANALQGGGTVRTAMPLMQADLAAQVRPLPPGMRLRKPAPKLETPDTHMHSMRRGLPGCFALHLWRHGALGLLACVQTGQSALGTYLQGQTIAAHGGHPSLGLQQVQVIQTQGYRVNSGVMQQPYIIQQGPSQYVTVGSPSGFGTAVQTMGGPGSDGGLNRGETSCSFCVQDKPSTSLVCISTHAVRVLSIAIQKLLTASKPVSREMSCLPRVCPLKEY